MKKAEMKKVISKIIKKERDYVMEMKSDTNPQIQERVQYADGKIDILIAVLNSLEGSDVLLKLHAE
jgi:hypothetical protein